MHSGYIYSSSKKSQLRVVSSISLSHAKVNIRGGGAGRKYSWEVGESFAFHCAALVLSTLWGALVTALSFLQSGDALKLTLNHLECSTTLSSSLAVDLPLALYPNETVAGYLPSQMINQRA